MKYFNITIILFTCFSFFNCNSSQSINHDLTRKDAQPVTLTQLTELKEAKGWYRYSDGKWSSSNKSRIPIGGSENYENNFTHITLYETNYNGKIYNILDIGYLNFVSFTDTKYGFIGSTMVTWGESKADTEEWNTYYIINPKEFKISLKENKAIRNSIKLITYSTNTPNDNLQRSVTSNLRREEKFGGRIHFYTFYNKDDNVIRFYIEHRNSTGINRSKVFEDYYYEIEYQKFIEVFGKWLK
jgi:hypothetical protein